MDNSCTHCACVAGPNHIGPNTLGILSYGDNAIRKSSNVSFLSKNFANIPRVWLASTLQKNFIYAIALHLPPMTSGDPFTTSVSLNFALYVDNGNIIQPPTPPVSQISGLCALVNSLKCKKRNRLGISKKPNYAYTTTDTVSFRRRERLRISSSCQATGSAPSMCTPTSF